MRKAEMNKRELGQKAIFNRLNQYFLEKYGMYENTAEWYPDDSDVKWTCDIKEIGKTIVFCCDPKSGFVTETAYDLR